MFMLCKPSVDFLGQNEPIGTTLGVTNLFLTCLYVSQTKIFLKCVSICTMPLLTN